MSDIQEEQKKLYKRAEENDKKIKITKKEILGICEFLRVHHFENAYTLYDYVESKDKEIERLNNIINAKDYKIKRLVYSCYESDMSYGEFKAIWVNAFEKLYDPKDIDKLENELKRDNK